MQAIFGKHFRTPQQAKGSRIINEHNSSDASNKQIQSLADVFRGNQKSKSLRSQRTDSNVEIIF